MVQQEHAGFVEEGEGREVAGVGAGRFEDEAEFVACAVGGEVSVWVGVGWGVVER